MAGFHCHLLSVALLAKQQLPIGGKKFKHIQILQNIKTNKKSNSNEKNDTTLNKS